MMLGLARTLLSKVAHRLRTVVKKHAVRASANMPDALQRRGNPNITLNASLYWTRRALRDLRVWWAHRLHVQSLQVIPERAMMTYVNEKYLYKNTTMNVRRYGRKSAYYINIEGITKMTFGNNVSLNLIFFEFLHNEYKRSFVEMKFPRICDALNSDPYIGGAFKLIGLVCPVPPGLQRLMNISVPMHDFPNVWPFERCKVEATLLQNKNRETMATADIFAQFKQKPRRK